MATKINASLRKIWSGVVLLIIGTIFAYAKGDIPPNYANFLTMMFYGFVVGNGFEHFTNMKVAQASLGADKEEKKSE